MEDEDKNNTEQAGEETTEEPTKPLNIVEEARQERTKLDETLAAIKEERQALETLKANEALAGETGGNVKAEPKEVSDEDYAQSALKGEIGENGKE